MNLNKETAIVQRANGLPVRHLDHALNIVTPSTDVFETSDAFVLVIDLPGAQLETVSVSIQEHNLTVRAKPGALHKESATFLMKELHDATYHRAFRIADGIDRDSIDAQFSDGVLTLKLFKKEKAKRREIKIK